MFPSIQASSSLEQVLQDSIRGLQSAIAAKRLQVQIDIQDVAESTCSGRLASGIRQVLRRAVFRSPLESKIEICAVETQQGLEVEIADSGSESFEEVNARGAFTRPQIASREMDLRASQESIEGPILNCLPCPQGGLAWTLFDGVSAQHAKVA